MAHRVVWSPRALADVQAIAEYVAKDSASYASTVVRKILASTRSLADFPFSGRIVPEFEEETLREVFAYSYRVIYRIEDDSIIVAAVIHGKRMI
jgi:toxin ParE1/3/4